MASDLIKAVAKNSDAAELAEKLGETLDNFLTTSENFMLHMEKNASGGKDTIDIISAAMEFMSENKVKEALKTHLLIGLGRMIQSMVSKDPLMELLNSLSDK